MVLVSFGFWYWQSPHLAGRLFGEGSTHQIITGFDLFALGDLAALKSGKLWVAEI
jgi:hypothetical protein